MVAQAGLGLHRDLRCRPAFAEGVFDGDLAVAEGEDVAALFFDGRAVLRISPRAYPLRHPAITAMGAVIPARIGEGGEYRGEYRGEGRAHGIGALGPGAAGSDKYAVLCHVRHQRVDVVAFQASAKVCRKGTLGIGAAPRVVFRQ